MFDQADEWCRLAVELVASDDIVTQVLWRRAKAKLLAQAAGYGEAEALVRDSLRLLEQTDVFKERAEA